MKHRLQASQNTSVVKYCHLVMEEVGNRSKQSNSAFRTRGNVGIWVDRAPSCSKLVPVKPWGWSCSFPWLEKISISSKHMGTIACFILISSSSLFKKKILEGDAWPGVLHLFLSVQVSLE